MNKNADYAIGLKVRKLNPGEEIDEGCTKFYGRPTLPESLVNKYPENYIFFLQIRCADLKDLDPENRLPHQGYLYFFIDSYDLSISLDYTLDEPKYLIDNFNSLTEFGEELCDVYVVELEGVDKYYTGTKLLGYPSNYVDEHDDKPSMLLQYDPLEFDVPFLATCDGYAFVFFGETKKTKFSNAFFEVVNS